MHIFVKCIKIKISAQMSPSFQIIKHALFLQDIHNFNRECPKKYINKYRQVSKHCIWCLKVCWNGVNSKGIGSPCRVGFPCMTSARKFFANDINSFTLSVYSFQLVVNIPFQSLLFLLCKLSCFTIFHTRLGLHNF